LKKVLAGSVKLGCTITSVEKYGMHHRILVNLLCLAAFCCFTVGVAAFADTRWNDSFYDAFDAEGFRNYEPAGQPIDFDNIDYGLLNAAIFYETNRVRLKHGKPVFRHARPLEEAALLHARDMVQLWFFSHQNPHEPEKRTLSQRLALFGVEGGYRAENISEAFGIRYTQGTSIIPPERGSSIFRYYETGKVIPNHSYISFAEALLQRWMDSAGHRANVLSERFNYLGCGAFHYRNEAFYGIDQFKAVQNFASSLNSD
jgi:uncharacterized protein YkwD